METPPGYSVYWMVSGGGSWMGPTSTSGLSQAISGLICGTAYTVKVTAVNGAGESSPGATATGTTSACPAAQVTTQGPYSLLVDWPDDVGALRYEVWRNGVLIATVDAPTSQYLDTGFHPVPRISTKSWRSALVAAAIPWRRLPGPPPRRWAPRRTPCPPSRSGHRFCSPCW